MEIPCSPASFSHQPVLADAVCEALVAVGAAAPGGASPS
jgi:hypothetical protein